MPLKKSVANKGIGMGKKYGEKYKDNDYSLGEPDGGFRGGYTKVKGSNGDNILIGDFSEDHISGKRSECCGYGEVVEV